MAKQPKGRRTEGRIDDPMTARVLAAILNSPDTAIIGESIDGIVTSWNRGAEEIFGYSAAEMIGYPIERLESPDRPGEMAGILERVRRGERVERIETERQHKDGRSVHILLTVTPIHDADGRLIGASKIAHDITALRHAQTMIAEREAHLRSVLETAPDAIITIDERGHVQSFSQAAERLFGYAAGEVIGRNVKMLMPAPYQGEHDGYLERYRRTSERHIIGIGRQVEARRKDGTVFPMELSVGEVGLGDARIFTGFIRDVTARARIEAELRQAQKMEAVGQLTGGVAHDFNNLLTVIAGNLELLERRIEQPEYRELLQEAQEATELGAQLSRRLLAFGRRQALDPKPIDPSALVQGMVDLLRRTLGENVRIETRLGAGLPMTMADPGQLENALLNLSINARDAMPSGGTLIIEASRAVIDAQTAILEPGLAPGSYVALAVTDTGSGMTEEVKNRAFDPFFTTKASGVGSGLGLSMVYGFVKQSGGHVRLYSEVEHGTTVRLYLPARLETEAAVTNRPSAPARRGEARGEVILVVEDQDRVRRVTVRRLKELGHTVIEAESAAVALAILDRGEPIDLLFTDVVMPGGMTGIELAHSARQRRPGLKILFTSGFTELENVRQGALTADAGWLAKPYGIDELQAKLRELFA